MLRHRVEEEAARRREEPAGAPEEAEKAPLAGLVIDDIEVGKDNSEGLPP